MQSTSASVKELVRSLDMETVIQERHRVRCEIDRLEAELGMLELVVVWKESHADVLD